jgi:hypothetical protein
MAQIFLRCILGVLQDHAYKRTQRVQPNNPKGCVILWSCSMSATNSMTRRGSIVHSPFRSPRRSVQVQPLSFSLRVPRSLTRSQSSIPYVRALLIAQYFRHTSIYTWGSKSRMETEESHISFHSCRTTRKHSHTRPTRSRRRMCWFRGRSWTHRTLFFL